MATNTTRLALRKPVDADDVDVDLDLSANFDKLDAAAGAVTCTSSVRPSSPFNGMLARESDTGNLIRYNGTSWDVVVTSDPAAGTAGMRTLGTTATSAAAGNDSRITGAQQTSAKGAASGYASLDSGTKVPIAQLPTGTSSTTVAIGNDSRLSDARTPTAHVHSGADVTTGTVPYARLPVGTAASTVAAGDDSRITGAQQTSAKGAASGYAGLDSGTKVPIAQLPTGTTSSTVAIGNDSRLSDARTPTAHKTSHATGGSDALTAADIGAATSGHTHSAPTPVTLTDGATVALDASLGEYFRLSAGGDRTIGVPTNAVDCKPITIEILASAAARTITLTTGSSGAFLFGSDITALSQTASGKRDLIRAVYNSTAARWLVIAYVKGF